MVCTRPDISQAVGVVSRYMHDPGKEHWQAVKWILRYIQSTVDVGLIFEQDDSQHVVGFCDSDYAGNLDKRRSTTGYIFYTRKSTSQLEVYLTVNGCFIYYRSGVYGNHRSYKGSNLASRIAW